MQAGLSQSVLVSSGSPSRHMSCCPRASTASPGTSGTFWENLEEHMGNPFVHVELNTSDVDKAKKFYGQLFAWKFEDVAMGPSGQYTMIKPGEGTGGGMLKHPMPGEPSMWLAYVLVEDVA